MMFRLTHHPLYSDHLETRAGTTHLIYSTLWLLVFIRYPFWVLTAILSCHPQPGAHPNALPLPEVLHFSSWTFRKAS